MRLVSSSTVGRLLGRPPKNSTRPPVAARCSAATGGRVLFFGGLPTSRPTVELNTNLIHYKELLVAGTTASTLDDCRRAAEIVGRGRIELDWMVSDRYALEDFAEAVGRAQDPAALKVVVKPSLSRKTL